MAAGDERQREWGRNVRIGRQALGMTQAHFGALIGVRQSTVTRWEHGLLAPRDDMKIRIADALHQDVRQLFPLLRKAS